jgi:membrane-bound serine protease (ClpP class)
LRGFLLLALTLVALAVPIGAGGQDSERRVLAVHLDNDINPVTQEYVENAVDRAEDEGLAAVVLVLDTPGGLASSMRGIVKRFLASKVPVIVYVSPPGSSADSAGAVIAMSADIAAMAPQTNIGSSTPISLGGEDISKDLRRKIVNDAAAYVGELAREHDRNVVAARKMVTEAANYGARNAKAIGLVEVIAPTLPALLNRVDGTKTVPKGLVLETAGAQIENVEMSFWQRARDFLVDPNLIALMLSIGLIGIVVELWNPGLIFPGTVGAISLILGLYGLQVLPVSLAGLLLMILAAAFFVAEVVHSRSTDRRGGDVVLGPGCSTCRRRSRRRFLSPSIAATLALPGIALVSGSAVSARRGRGAGGRRCRQARHGAANGELWRARVDETPSSLASTSESRNRGDLRLVVDLTTDRRSKLMTAV